MKHLLLTTIAAVVLVGCGESQQPAPAPEVKPVEPVAEAAKPEPPTAKAPAISIHEAAEEGNIEAVKQHLAAGTDMNAKTPNGWTPLLMAISYAQKEIIELLIAEGANVNAKNDDGETPLHYVAFVGQKEIPKEIAELLIAKGADVNAKSNEGDTPLDVAINDDVAEIEIANLIRKHGGKAGKELKAAEPVVEAAKPKQPTAKEPDISIHDAAQNAEINKTELTSESAVGLYKWVRRKITENQKGVHTKICTIKLQLD